MTQDSLTADKITLDGHDKKSRLVTGAMLHNAAYNIKENRKLMAVLFVLHTAALPLILFMLIYSILTKGVEQADAYIVIGVITTGAGAAAGVICALSTFKYLYNKSSVDMRLSLPMTTTQRFLSDFFSGLFVYIVPFIAAQLLSMIFLLVGHIACDGKTFTYNYDTNLYYHESAGADYGADYSDRTYTWVCDIFEQYAPVLIKGIIGAAAIMIMFYIFTVLVSSCCGSLFECAAYSVMANILVPLGILMVILALTYNVKGLDPTYYIDRILPYTSPAGGAYALIMLSQDEAYGARYDDEYTLNVPGLVGFGMWLLIFALVTAALGVLAWYVYLKRRAEDTGKPIVYGVFYHIIMTMAIICITYAFVSENDLDLVFVPMLIVTAIIYMVFTVIRNRGFSHFVKGIVFYVLTMAVSLGSYALFTGTECFGAGNYIPDAADISKAYISYNGFYERSNFNDFGSAFERSSGNVACITDPAALEAVTAAHRYSVEDDDRVPTDEGVNTLDGGSFRIYYKLKSGRYVLRDYSMMDETMVILSSIDCSDEMKEYRAYNIRDNIISTDKIIKENISNNVYSKNDLEELNGIVVYTKWRYNGTLSFSDRVTIPYRLLPPDFAQHISDCLYKDIMNESEEDYFGYDGNTYILDCMGPIYYIKENYANTIEYLRQCGMEDLPEISDTLAENYVRANMNISMVSVPLMEHIGGKDMITGSSLRTDSEGWVRNMRIYDYAEINYASDELQELLECSQKMYKTDDACYTISVDGNTAVIPMQYSELAEKVYTEAVIANFVKSLEQYYSSSESAYYDNDSYYEYNYAEIAKQEIASTSSEFGSSYKSFLKYFLEFYGDEKAAAAADRYLDRQYGEYSVILREEDGAGIVNAMKIISMSGR